MATTAQAKTFARSQRRGNKGHIKGFTFANAILNKGDYGLKAVQSGILSEKCIEGIRIALSRKVPKNQFRIINVRANKARTQKPTGARMGGGKAPLDKWICKIKKGTILFEIDGMSTGDARKICSTISYRIGFKTCFVEREGYE